MSDSLSARTVRISGDGGIPDQRLIGDVGGAAAYLREPPTSNGKVGVIGYCSRGRQSVLAACHLDLAAGPVRQAGLQPNPDQVAELDGILTAHHKQHEFHSYDDAGHAFFAVDQPAYRIAAANDGWQRIATFFGTYLGS